MAGEVIKLLVKATYKDRTFTPGATMRLATTEERKTFLDKLRESGNAIGLAVIENGDFYTVVFDGDDNVRLIEPQEIAFGTHS